MNENAYILVVLLVIISNYLGLHNNCQAKMRKMKCPKCGKGILKKGKIKEKMFGVYLGDFPALVCDNCQESFTDSSTTKEIEGAAKKKGIWGLNAVTKITKTGNSLAVRIPKKIADFLHIEHGKEAYVYPEGNKLIIETKA